MAYYPNDAYHHPSGYIRRDVGNLEQPDPRGNGQDPFGGDRPAERDHPHFRLFHPENADRFFTPIQDVVERYALAPRPKTSVHIALTYFNSSTSKYLLDLLKRWRMCTPRAAPRCCWNGATPMATSI